MRAIESWVLTYLLNSAWQAPLVLAAAWVLARAVRRLGVDEEHRVWCGALLCATFLPMCSVNAHALLDEVRSRWMARFAGGPHGGASVTVTMGDAHAGHGFGISVGWLYAALWLYGLVVAYSLSRLAWGLWQTHRLRRRSTAAPLDGSVGVAWHRYAKRFGVLATELATVPDLPGPMTVGVSRRMLLLPETWLGTVDPEDLDAAIAHECAHMQRRDFAKNLLYRTLTLPVSYHPVVWMMHGRVVETREMICDAMAADAVAGRERYARSLLRLAANLVAGSRRQDIHAIGIFDANNFERRVMNLTMKRTDTRRMRRVAIKAACVVVGCGTAVSALALRMQVGIPESHAMVRQHAQTNSAAPATMVLAVPRDGQATPPATMEVETTQALGSSDGSGAPRVKLSSPPSIATIDIHPADSSAAEATPAQMQSQSGVQAGESPAKIRADIMAGQTLSKVTPVYPSAAKDGRIQGAVVLHAVIGKDGAVERLDVVSGPEELRASAIDAVRHWVYKPYLLNGNPTEVDTTITVHYNLAN